MYIPVNMINFCCLIIAIFLMPANAVYSQTTPRQNLLLESTFEGAGYLAGWDNNQHCCAYSVQQTTERVKAGSNALRLEVRSTDAPTSEFIRSEITLDSDPLNQDRWYGFSMYLKDWIDDDAGESVFQWAQDNTNGSAAMTLLTSGGRFIYTTNNNGTTSNNVYTDIGPVISNQWIDFVIRIRWATDTTGLLQVWMNGNPVINKSNVKTAAVTSFFKLGISKFGWSTQTSAVTQRILYFDEVRRGNASATYKDVAPFLPRRDYFQGL
jgi:Polysaccharide lyase